ncbi:2-polyprenyl-3-methyl-5-hydroxy-6-metoxy-1,4-benzoquinol methylase [Catenulispora sp. GAS73]|uniref:class I SAM-dependent methyltransferase n=1 Tax=Catenulispora sp. GAS73 TaxID=3156269 RepID=UPI0035153CE4
MTMTSLRALYEDPATTIASGHDRTVRQIGMLTGIVRAAGRPLRILDVGCGDGAATAQAARACPGHEVIGMDWSGEAVKRAASFGLTVVQGSVDSPGLPIADASVDVVVFSEIIEHLVDTDAALGELRRVLRPGGTLLLSTPNLAAWFNRGLLALGVQPLFSEVSLRAIHGRPGREVVGHLHLFTRRALVSLLAANGFRVERVAGARYHDVPGILRPLDRLFRWRSTTAAILLVAAVKPEPITDRR